jgi:hypothetical protein
MIRHRLLVRRLQTLLLALLAILFVIHISTYPHHGPLRTFHILIPAVSTAQVVQLYVPPTAQTSNPSPLSSPPAPSYPPSDSGARHARTRRGSGCTCNGRGNVLALVVLESRTKALQDGLVSDIREASGFPREGHGVSLRGLWSGE